MLEEKEEVLESLNKVLGQTHEELKEQAREDKSYKK